MKLCNCNQGRTPCDCQRTYERGDKVFKWVLLFAALYFLGHIVHALAAEPVIINTPDGGQRVCIVSGGYVTCY